MYPIVMNEDKDLIARHMPTIYQRESLVDELCFVFPETYHDISFVDATAVLKYTDAANVAHAEMLKPESLYENKISFVLPIDTKITKFSGDVIFSITLTKIDLENNKQYVLHTNDKTLKVLPKRNLYDFVPDESLEFVDQIVGDLNAKIQVLEKLADEFDKTKADDLSYNNNKLQLTANGQPIGSSVDIVGGSSSGESSFEIVEF